MSEVGKEKRTLTLDEARKLLQIAEDDRVRMRAGKEPDLTINDVDELRVIFFNSGEVTDSENEAASRIISDWEMLGQRRYYSAKK